MSEELHGMHTLTALIDAKDPKYVSAAKRRLKDMSWMKSLHRSVQLIWTELQKLPLRHTTPEERRQKANEAAHKWNLELSF